MGTSNWYRHCKQSTRQIRSWAQLVRTDNPAKDFNFIIEEAFPDILPKVQSGLKVVGDRMDVLEREIAAMQQGSSPESVPIPLPRAPPEKSSFQLVRPGEMITKINALVGTLQGNGPHVFSLDAEWDTHESGGKKGKVPLVQIGYHDVDENCTKPCYSESTLTGSEFRVSFACS
jgi:hypothetical protein